MYNGMPCSLGSVYIETTRCSVNTRLNEYQRCYKLKETIPTAVAEQPGNNIFINIFIVLKTTTLYFTRLHREAVKINKQRQNNIHVILC